MKIKVSHGYAPAQSTCSDPVRAEFVVTQSDKAEDTLHEAHRKARAEVERLEAMLDAWPEVDSTGMDVRAITTARPRMG